MITRHHNNTNIHYIFYGTPVNDRYKHNAPYKLTVESWKVKDLEKIAKTGEFTYHEPEMWMEKCATREPGYDIVCKVEKIEKVTEVTTWTHEDIALEDVAR